MAETLTSNRGKYKYRLTRNRLYSKKVDRQPSYRLSRIDFQRAGKPTVGFGENPSARACIRVCRGRDSRRRAGRFFYWIDEQSFLHIGCRVFGPRNAAKLLRWAGIVL